MASAHGESTRRQQRLARPAGRRQGLSQAGRTYVHIRRHMWRPGLGMHVVLAAGRAQRMSVGCPDVRVHCDRPRRAHAASVLRGFPRILTGVVIMLDSGGGGRGTPGRVSQAQGARRSVDDASPAMRSLRTNVYLDERRMKMLPVRAARRRVLGDVRMLASVAC